MSPELIAYIIKYGYLAVFSTIFLQEIGVPSPVPNEIILLFAGYLASIGTLKFSLILLFGIAGDFIGTTVLYLIFYFFGDRVMKLASRFFPAEKIEKFKENINRRGSLGVFLGRLVPYLRGYASVAAGLMKIPPSKFLPAVVASAMIWSGGYVTAGRLLGHRWEKFAEHLTIGRILTGVVVVAVLVVFVIPRIKKYFHARKLNRQKKNQENSIDKKLEK